MQAVSGSCSLLSIAISILTYFSLTHGSLRQACRYENAASSTTPFPDIENALTPEGIKLAIIQRLSGLGPRAIVSIYARAIFPWFSFTSESKLDKRFPQTWKDASVDLTLLAFMISLFDASPQLPRRCYELGPDTKSKYMLSKSWLALIEGSGLNSLDLVTVRLLLTLFEMVHGLYPAAYLSIAATIRAADILSINNCQDNNLVRSSGFTYAGVEESSTELWCYIVVLDRCVHDFISIYCVISQHTYAIYSC